ncbi:hypothetical protein H4I96_02826 [Botrytis cinerea]
MLDATPEINKPSTETPITPMDVDPPERYSFRKRKRDDSEPDEHVQKTDKSNDSDTLSRPRWKRYRTCHDLHTPHAKDRPER